MRTSSNLRFEPPHLNAWNIKGKKGKTRKKNEKGKKAGQLGPATHRYGCRAPAPHVLVALPPVKQRPRTETARRDSLVTKYHSLFSPFALCVFQAYKSKKRERETERERLVLGAWFRRNGKLERGSHISMATDGHVPCDENFLKKTFDVVILLRANSKGCRVSGEFCEVMGTTTEHLSLPSFLLRLAGRRLLPP
ncbi:Potassium transporter [Psidium guajava]|nr:Potassium transporter [Psidium guajava]